MTTEQKIYDTARADGMPQALSNYIVAQSKHETGNYKSPFFTKGNNAFGYSFVSGSKWQLPAGGGIADNGKPIAQYASIYNSVHELTDWIKRRQREKKFPANLNTIDSPEKYATLLKQANYYGDTLTNYTAGLIRALRTFGNLGGLTVNLGIIIIGIILILFLI